MTHSSMLVLSMFLWSQSTPPSIEEVKLGIEKNYASYSDVEFLYNVKVKNKDGQFEESRNTYRLHIPENGTPWQYLVEEKNTVIQLIEVKEIGEVNGLVFPKKGRWSDAPGESNPGVDYSFEVMEVNRLENSTQGDWLPEFPAGTSVSDQIDDRRFYVPWSERQREKAASDERSLPRAIRQ